MDRRYPSIRRRVKRARLQQRVAAALMLAIAGGVLGFALTGQSDTTMAGEAAPTFLALASAPGQASPERAAPRRIYPYSIVPGGAATQTELARVIRTDKVVAAHYASFDVDKARIVAVAKPRAVHVSYRKGDQVYWTAKKVMLAEGETLLSDGNNEMRTRCANRISDVAQFPIEAQEPSAEVLDSVVEEDGAGPARAGGDPSFALADGAGMLRRTGRGIPSPVSSGNANARAAANEAGKAPSSGDNTGMNSMTLAQFGSSGSLASLLRSGSVAPPGAGLAPPTLEVSTDVPAPDAPASQLQQGATPPATGPAPVPASGAGGTVPDTVVPVIPGAQPPAPGGSDARPPAGGDIPSGSSGGGGNVAPPAQPAPVEGGVKPGPFIPEPSLSVPPPAAPAVGEPPAAGDVPEPPTSWLLGAALAGLLVRRRRAA